MAKCLLIPDAWDGRAAMPQTHKALFSYCNSVMEPWDGPAAICAIRRPLGGRRHRPQRPAPAALRAHRRRPADRRLRDRHGEARRGPHQPQGPPRPRPDDRRRSRAKAGSTTTARSRTRSPPNAAYERLGRATSPSIDEPLIETRRRAGALREGRAAPPPGRGRALAWKTSSWCSSRWWRTARKPIGSMGDDTPLAVLSRPVSRPASHFFRQNFSQVTNPPIDSLARAARDEPEDALRQPRQHPGRGRGARPTCCSSNARCCSTGMSSRRMRAYIGQSVGGDRLHLRSPRRRPMRCATRIQTHPPRRPRMRCAAAPPT